MFLHFRGIIICYVLNLTFYKEAAEHNVKSRPFQHATSFFYCISKTLQYFKMNKGHTDNITCRYKEDYTNQHINSSVTASFVH